MSATDGVRHERIESLSNPLVKELRELRTRKGRLEQRRFMAEGERTLAEAAAGGWRAALLLVTPDAPRSAVAAERVIEVTDEVLAKITGRDNPQPQLGIFSEPDHAARSFTAIDPATASRWLMLEAPRDPGNLGSCIRSADAVAAGGVLLVGDACDAYSVECVRATMGSIFSVPIFRVSFSRAGQGRRLRRRVMRRETMHLFRTRHPQRSWLGLRRRASQGHFETRVAQPQASQCSDAPRA
ncbi:MAG: hypothetical protein RI921_1137 [Chloroflexota bacterium]